jgi:transposase
VPASSITATAASLRENQELAAHGSEAFPGSGHQTAQEEELRRLKRELEVTRQERDILKKALIVFSKT